ncbi:MAG: AsmA-like C-terminal region-containing protein [Saprospiraceae bacterium]
MTKATTKKRRYGRIVLGVFGALILFILLAPRLFKGKILERVKREVDARTTVVLDFDDVSLAWWKHFPDLSLVIDKIRLQGKDTFADITLFQAEELGVDFNFWDVLRNQDSIRIQGIHLEQPDLRIQVLENGLANYDITGSAPDSAPESANSFRLDLQRLDCRNGSLQYRDYQQDMYLRLTGLQQDGSITYEQNLVNAGVDARADSVDFVYSGVHYLSNAQVIWQGPVRMDLDAEKYSFDQNAITINALPVDFNGWVDLQPESVDMDLAFKTPSSDVKQMLSLVPGAYHHYYEGIRATGKANLEVTLQGSYQDGVSYPALHLATQVSDGKIQYAGAPFPIDQLKVDAEINTRDPLYNTIDVDLRDLHAVVKDSPLDGQLALRSTSADVLTKGHLKTDLDLASWIEAFQLQDKYPLRGHVAGNAEFDFSQSAVLAKRYQDVRFSGSFTGKDMAGQLPGYPAFAVSQASLQLDPANIHLMVREVKAGQTQGNADLQIRDPLSYLTGGSRTAVDVDLTLSRLDLNEWTSGDETVAVATDESYVPAFTPLPPVRINWNANIDQIDYADYDLNHLVSTGHYQGDTLTLQQTSCRLSGEPIQLSGTLRGPYRWYGLPGSSLSGELAVDAGKLDLNPWLAVDTTSSNASPDTSQSAEILPANVSLKINAAVDELIYDKYHLKKSSGVIELSDRELSFTNMKTNLLGGNVDFEGLYSEQGEHPEFDLKYDMRKMKFAPLFQTSSTFRKLAPIANYIDGIFSSTLILSGKLGDGWMPIWDQLNAAGFLETESARLQNFDPIREVANRLQIKELQDISWKNSRNWFEVVDGAVTIKPFTFDYQDMRFTVQGHHQIDQDIQYQVLLRIPRTLLTKLHLDQPVNAGVQWFQSQASKYGVEIGQLDTAYVRIQFTGKITKPEVALQWVTQNGETSAGEALKSQVQSEIERGKDTLVQKGEEVLDKAKDTLAKVIDQKSQEVIDKAQDKAREVIDTAKNQVTRQAREKLDSLAGQKVGQAIDSLLPPGLDSLGGVKTKEEIDKLKSILKGWDPLKKKKKSGGGN